MAFENYEVYIPSPCCVLDDKTSEDGTHAKAREERKDVHGGEEALRETSVPDIANDPRGDVRQCRCAGSGYNSNDDQGSEVMRYGLRYDKDDEHSVDTQICVSYTKVLHQR